MSALHIASLPKDVAERRSGGRSTVPRALFICGSMNQTTQMHQIAEHLPEVEAAFSSYYVDGFMKTLRSLRLLDMSIAGVTWQARCEKYLLDHKLRIDFGGERGPYDLVLTCQDAIVPRNVLSSKVVLVQEGMTDPPDLMSRLHRKFRWIPRALGSTALTGLSDEYVRFCVASPGYREKFVQNGVRAEKIVVTGIPNFDDCARYRHNGFPHRGYVLACTSDGRETFKRDDRGAFLRHVRAVAAGRPLLFKLHPNERWNRAKREIARMIPEAVVYTAGSAEEMVANCDVLVCEYSSLAYVGLALEKEVHSYFDLGELRRLLPLQHGRAAANIADVCRDLLGLANRTRAGGLEDVMRGSRPRLPATNASLPLQRSRMA